MFVQYCTFSIQNFNTFAFLFYNYDRDFLPRGFGIVTRRPLVLQLYCINPDEHTKEELAK